MADAKPLPTSEQFDALFSESLRGSLRKLELQRFVAGIRQKTGLFLIFGILGVMVPFTIVAVHNQGRPSYERRAHPDALDAIVNKYEDLRLPKLDAEVFRGLLLIVLGYVAAPLLMVGKGKKTVYHVRFRNGILAPILNLFGVTLPDGGATEEPFTAAAGPFSVRISTSIRAEDFYDSEARNELCFLVLLDRPIPGLVYVVDPGYGTPEADDVPPEVEAILAQSEGFRVRSTNEEQARKFLSQRLIERIAKLKKEAPGPACVSFTPPSQLNVNIRCPVVPGVGKSIGSRTAKDIFETLRAALGFIRDLPLDLP
jgi:hypothetical protein